MFSTGSSADDAERNKGLLGPDDLPEEFSVLTTTIAAKTSEEEGEEIWRPTEHRYATLNETGDPLEVMFIMDHPSGAGSCVTSVPNYDTDGMPDHTGTGSNEATMWRNDRLEKRFVTGDRIDSIHWFSWQDGKWRTGNVRCIRTILKVMPQSQPSVDKARTHGSLSCVRPFTKRMTESMSH